MGDGVFNIAKGRVVEYYNRVENNDPAASELSVILFTGTVTDAVLEDLDDIGAVVASALVEALFTNYARKVLTSTELSALPAPDDTNNRFEVDIPDQVYTSAGNGTNSTLTRLVIAYDAAGTDVDASMIPLTFHDFAVTTDGSTLTAVINAAGFFRAS